MTNTQTILPKIILTNSFELAELLSLSTSYKNFVEEVDTWKSKLDSDERDQILFLTSDNSNILNFEYNYFGTGSQQSGLRVNIDFFDPTDLFEKTVISKSIKERFYGSTYYIAFGASPDLSNWTNFLVADLVFAEIFQDYDKPKVLRLNLAAAIGLHELNSDVFKKYSRTVSEIVDKMSLYLSEKIPADYDINNESLQVKPINNSSELLQIFKGYNNFDSAFKSLVLKFLKSIFSEKFNILFLCEDIDLLLDKRAPPSSFDPTNTIFNVNNVREWVKYVENYDKAIELDARLAKDEDENTINITQRDNIFNFLDLVTTQFSNLKVKIKVSLVADDISTPDIFFGDVYENFLKKKKRIALSISIPEREEKETDDTFSQKIEDVLVSIQDLFTFRLDEDSEQGVLLREPDTRIIKLLIAYLEQEGRTDLIKEFNLTPEKPLIIFGQNSIIQAILYGRELKSKKINSLNTLAKKYLQDTLNTKLETVNYGLYGSKNNLLTPLQKLLVLTGDSAESLLEANNIDITKLLVFKHNIGNSNVLEISVNDYKAYHGFLGVPRLEKPTSTPEEVLLTKQYIRGFLEPESSTEGSPRTITDDLVELSKNDTTSEKIRKFINYVLQSRTFREDIATPFIRDSLKYAAFDYTKAAKLKQDFDSVLVALSQSFEKGVSADFGLKMMGYEPIASSEDYFNILLRDLSSSMYRVTIKTLPFFFVTGPVFLQEPCLLLSQRLNLLNAEPSQLDTVITGGYIIIGITHKITKDSAQSEFILQKLQSPL